MIISKNSWHYRFTETWGVLGFERRCREGKHTTCSYIRAVVYAAVRCFIALAFALTIGSAFLFIAAAMISVPIAIASGVVIVKGMLLHTMLPMCVVGWTGVGVGLLGYLASLAGKRISRYSERRQSLLLQAMQDKKDGVCTLVKIVD